MNILNFLKNDDFLIDKTKPNPLKLAVDSKLKTALLSRQKYTHGNVQWTDELAFTTKYKLQSQPRDHLFYIMQASSVSSTPTSNVTQHQNGTAIKFVTTWSNTESGTVQNVSSSISAPRFARSACPEMLCISQAASQRGSFKNRPHFSVQRKQAQSLTGLRLARAHYSPSLLKKYLRKAQIRHFSLWHDRTHILVYLNIT